MSGTYLLDTNAIIARIAGEGTVIAFLQRADEIFIPVVALGEMYFGAEKSSRVTENVAAIDRFMAGRAILVCNDATARWYGRIMHQLQQKGRPIPQNDIWIAALAMQHNLVLLTRDQHFQHVDDLRHEAW